MRVEPPFPPDAVKEARKWPNGWVYEIDPEYAGIESVPGTAIRGAWELDAKGELTGEFEENPNYRGNARDSSPRRGAEHTPKRQAWGTSLGRIVQQGAR